MIHVLHDPRMGVNAYACARTESLSPGLHTSPLRAAFAPTGAFGSVPQLFSHSPGYSPLRLEKHLTSASHAPDSSQDSSRPSTFSVQRSAQVQCNALRKNVLDD